MQQWCCHLGSRAVAVMAACLMLGCADGTGLPAPPSDVFRAVLYMSRPVVTVENAGPKLVCSFQVQAFNATGMALKITSARARFRNAGTDVVSCSFIPPFGAMNGQLLGRERATFTLTPCATSSVPPTGVPFALDVVYMDARGNYWTADEVGSFGWPF